mmetsp:Transcript_38311/g.63577  ORF Transcript_38311/g.63577 Transcript_38311/m.63577 type:complete len:258 (-) Transcript_38311:1245-2018(-)
MGRSGDQVSHATRSTKSVATSTIGNAGCHASQRCGVLIRVFVSTPILFCERPKPSSGWTTKGRRFNRRCSQSSTTMMNPRMRSCLPSAKTATKAPEPTNSRRRSERKTRLRRFWRGCTEPPRSRCFLRRRRFFRMQQNSKTISPSLQPQATCCRRLTASPKRREPKATKRKSPTPGQSPALCSPTFSNLESIITWHMSWACTTVSSASIRARSRPPIPCKKRLSARPSGPKRRGSSIPCPRRTSRTSGRSAHSTTFL